jgi:sodium transport system permease protein
MASVFVLLSAFSGGMSVAMDTMSGERERRSLLPLLLDGVPSWSIVLGKWLAASLFAAASLGLAFAAFTVVLTVASEAVRRPDWSVMWFAPPILALVLGAVSLELLVSTACRTTKEAHTWLSILLFVVMALAMWLAFRPAVAGGVSLALPIAGQQRLLQQLFEGLSPAPATAVALTAATGCLALPLLAGSRWLLQHESAVDG